jgi:hypothetical protein
MFYYIVTVTIWFIRTAEKNYNFLRHFYWNWNTSRLTGLVRCLLLSYFVLRTSNIVKRGLEKYDGRSLWKMLYTESV